MKQRFHNELEQAILIAQHFFYIFQRCSKDSIGWIDFVSNLMS